MQIVRLCTTYPRIRKIFLCSEHLAQSLLMEQGDVVFHRPWEFYRHIVLHCLRDNKVVQLTETKNPKELYGTPETLIGVLANLLEIEDEYVLWTN